MDIRFVTQTSGEWHCGCAISFCFEGEDAFSYAPSLSNSATWATIAPALRDVSGKNDEITVLHGHIELPITRVAMVGLGKKTELTLAKIRLAVAKVVQLCRSKKYETIGITFETLELLSKVLNKDPEYLTQEVLIAAKLSLYKCNQFRSSVPDEEVDPLWFGVLVSSKTVSDSLHNCLLWSLAEAKGVIVARDLINTPANLLTPEDLANKAKAIGSKYDISCKVLDEKKIQELGMGALWAVGKGSTEPPRFIVMEYCPKGKESSDPVIFVGKGITFDTGGISIKPSANMHEMKGDMGGAAAILGLFVALGEVSGSLTLPRTVGIIPTAENMPDGFSVKPGDVVTTLSGKTVEILNTDAEGRLILCDALTYAQKEYKPKALIDVATLTGACVIALGDLGAGLFTKDDKLSSDILKSADKVGDLFWPLPLWEEYDSLLKSSVADVANIGNRAAGSTQAALFLQRFIDKDTRWAHLDIAGPGYVTKTTPLHPVAGGTGVGVRLFCALLKDAFNC